MTPSQPQALLSPCHPDQMQPTNRTRQQAQLKVGKTTAQATDKTLKQLPTQATNQGTRETSTPHVRMTSRGRTETTEVRRSTKMIRTRKQLRKLPETKLPKTH